MVNTLSSARVKLYRSLDTSVMRATLRHDFEGAAANFRDRGCIEVRQKGSHLVVSCGKCQTVIPVHPGEDIGPGLLRAIERQLAPCLGKDGSSDEDVLPLHTILMKRAGGSPLFESSQAAIPKAARSSRREIGFVKQWSSSRASHGTHQGNDYLPLPCGEGSKPPNAPRREPPPNPRAPSRHPSSGARTRGQRSEPSRCGELLGVTRARAHQLLHDR